VRPPFKKSGIPAGEYAVMAYEGEPKGSSEAIMSLYSEWLPMSGFESDHFPLMEYYLNHDVSRQDGFVKMEIFIKLRALGGSV
jgi:AraC family transcriptional regulator